MRIPFISKGEPTPAPPEPTPVDGERSGKGRPTPTRKEAEAARKSSLKVPADPKEARKAARAREAAERDASRAALLAGDERGLPARDAGPVKSYVRDFVDKRWCAGELFLPLAIIVLVMAFVRNPAVQQVVTIMWFSLTLFIVIDTTLVMRKLSKELERQWPEKADRKGAIWYALMRVLQIRKLRLPPPRFRAGGRPVTPKVKK